MAPDHPLRVVIVGCGQIADGHVSEIAKLDNAMVVGVCDLELLMAEQLAQRMNVPSYYDDFDKMLEAQKPDVVHISTPPSSHLFLAKKAIDAGCHVYVEKPFALNYEDSVKIVEYAEKQQKKLTIGHTYEFDPPARQMREMIAQGVLGDPIHVESWFGYNLSGPFGKVILGSPDHWVHRLPGKLFQNNINHLLNKVIEFIPDEKPDIRAFGFKRREESFGDVRDDMDDELRVMIRGEKVSAYATFTSHVKPVAQFQRVYGSKNTMHLDFVTRTVTLDQGPTLPSAIGRLVPGFNQSLEYLKSTLRNVGSFAHSEFHMFNGLNYLIRAFYKSIQEDAPLPISYRDILRLSWMIDEIFAQISKGGAR